MSDRRIIHHEFSGVHFYVTIVLVATILGGYFLNQVFPRFGFYLNLVPGFVVVENYWWQVVTYFMIQPFGFHGIFGLVLLIIAGTALEQRIGSKEYAVFLGVNIVLVGLSALGLLWVTEGYLLVFGGATGLLYAVLIGALTYFPRTRYHLMGIIPLPLPLLALIWFALDLLIVLLGPLQTSSLTHLVGLVTGYLYMKLRFGVDPVRQIIQAWR